MVLGFLSCPTLSTFFFSFNAFFIDEGGEDLNAIKSGPSSAIIIFFGEGPTLTFFYYIVLVDE